MTKGEFILDRKLFSGKLRAYSFEELRETFKPYFEDGSVEGLSPREERLIATAWSLLQPYEGMEPEECMRIA